jgi:radical SAM-linked protein
MTIARPLPLGATGSAELCAIDLYEEPSALDFARALHAQMPRGMTVREVRLDRHLGKAPFGRLERAEYTVRVDGSAPDDLRGALATLLAVDQLNIERESKRGPRTVDIRPGICAAEVSADPPGLHLELACDEEYMVKPAEVINALNRILTAGGLPGAAAVEVHRVRLMAASEPAATGRPERVTHA